MLNRRRKIRKYISVLKNKQKKLIKHPILQYNSQVEDKQIKQEEEDNQQQIIHHNYFQEEKIDQKCWQDPDEEKQVQLQGKNMFTKLKLKNENPSERQYEGKLRQLYMKNNHDMFNWAQKGDIIEYDVNDYLVEQQIQYGVTAEHKKQVQFISRTNQKHRSVVTSLDWCGKVMFSTGLDQKLKVWSVHPQQSNIQLKLLLQKDIYIQKLPLTQCYYYQSNIYCGTLRKNYVIVDVNKWNFTCVTSTFLAQHQTYENLRINPMNNGNVALFSNQKISLMDTKNCYRGSLYANDKIVDLAFKDQYLYAVSSQALYQWDVRMMKPIAINKHYLRYTKINIMGDILTLGSKLGVIYLNTIANNIVKPYSQVSNLVTDVSGLNGSSNYQWMLATSKWKPNAIRIIDINKGKCLPSWPNVHTKVGISTAGCFSTNNQIFAIGSANGYITIFQLC